MIKQLPPNDDRLLTAAPPSNTRFNVLGFACSLSLITYLDRICIMRASADIKRDLHFTDPQMGLVFGAFTPSEAGAFGGPDPAGVRFEADDAYLARRYPKLSQQFRGRAAQPS